MYKLNIAQLSSPPFVRGFSPLGPASKRPCQISRRIFLSQNTFRARQERPSLKHETLLLYAEQKRAQQEQ